MFTIFCLLYANLRTLYIIQNSVKQMKQTKLDEYQIIKIEIRHRNITRI